MEYAALDAFVLLMLFDVLKEEKLHKLDAASKVEWTDLARKDFFAVRNAAGKDVEEDRSTNNQSILPKLNRVVRIIKKTGLNENCSEAVVPLRTFGRGQALSNVNGYGDSRTVGRPCGQALSNLNGHVDSKSVGRSRGYGSCESRGAIAQKVTFGRGSNGVA